MHTQLNHYQLARYALWLVTLVIFVCSSQNIGLNSTCSLQQSADPISYSMPTQKLEHSQSGARSADADGVAISEQCSLSDHLLQIHQQQLEQAIVCFIFIVLTFVLFAGPSIVTPKLTEPIPPTRRRHLTLCVFRE
ncbi:hypothetical protein [Photobacterium nomapromontoriensis]|uniref:hypothetical protein n=1 Tax=Photobacterium nomapromontoriensis TaxID=2910237 RepID=UPI003D111372